LSRGCAHANRHAAAKSRADAPTRARVQNIHDKSEPNLTPRRFRACERARARRRGWEPRTLPSRRFQVLLTLFSKFFASFPHGTCALSVFRSMFSFGRNLPPVARFPPSSLAKEGRKTRRMLRAAFSDNPTHEKDDARDSQSRSARRTPTTRALETRLERFPFRFGPESARRRDSSRKPRTGLSPSSMPLSKGLGPESGLRTRTSLSETTIREAIRAKKKKRKPFFFFAASGLKA